MNDAGQQGVAPGKTRPSFMELPESPATAGGAPSGGVSFFGNAQINGPVVGGNLTIMADSGHDERAYLFQVADVYSYWRNQYILGPASAQASPFITTDTAALVKRVIGARPGAGGGQTQRRPVALPDAINLYRRVLLLGKPGAGKTSYLQYLALQYTRPEAAAGLLPVLVELSAYTERISFLDFLRKFLRDPPNPPPPEPPFDVQSPWLASKLEEYLHAGRILLLLDGLNELPFEAPVDGAARRAELAGFFAAYPRLRAVVACRMLDYDKELDNAGFQTVLLDPWTVAQMAAYLEARGDTLLLARLQAQDPLLLSLGQVPFLLYMIAELAENYPPAADDAAALPFLTGQSALFKQFVALLLDWAELKDPEGAALFARPTVVAALARLAAAMQAVGRRGTDVEQGWASAQVAADPRAILAAPAPALPVGDPRIKLLDFGCAATILDTPAKRDKVRFWHLAHQDYFAALAPGQASGPLTPATDDLHSMAVAQAPQPAAAIAALLAGGDPRSPLVAAKALLDAGGG